MDYKERADKAFMTIKCNMRVNFLLLNYIIYFPKPVLPDAFTARLTFTQIMQNVYCDDDDLIFYF